MSNDDGDPTCHLCRGKGESQGRGQTHPCICLHWIIRELREEIAALKQAAPNGPVER